MSLNVLVLLMHQRLVDREIRRTKDLEKLAQLREERKRIGSLMRRVRKENRKEKAK